MVAFTFIAAAITASAIAVQAGPIAPRASKLVFPAYGLNKTAVSTYNGVTYSLNATFFNQVSGVQPQNKQQYTTTYYSEAECATFCSAALPGGAPYFTYESNQYYVGAAAYSGVCMCYQSIDWKSTGKHVVKNDALGTANNTIAIFSASAGSTPYKYTGQCGTVGSLGGQTSAGSHENNYVTKINGNPVTLPSCLAYCAAYPKDPSGNVFSTKYAVYEQWQAADANTHYCQCFSYITSKGDTTSPANITCNASGLKQIYSLDGSFSLAGYVAPSPDTTTI